MTIADMLAEAEARMLDEYPNLKQRIADLEAENREQKALIAGLVELVTGLTDKTPTCADLPITDNDPPCEHPLCIIVLKARAITKKVRESVAERREEPGVVTR